MFISVHRCNVIMGVYRGTEGFERPDRDDVSGSGEYLIPEDDCKVKRA
jgi:hypothetical protein